MISHERTSKTLKKPLLVNFKLYPVKLIKQKFWNVPYWKYPSKYKEIPDHQFLLKCFVWSDNNILPDFSILFSVSMKKENYKIFFGSLSWPANLKIIINLSRGIVCIPVYCYVGSKVTSAVKSTILLSLLQRLTCPHWQNMPNAGYILFRNRNSMYSACVVWKTLELNCQ